MKREIVMTADGSHTLAVPELNEHYHSVNGAVNEAYHVFIDAGLSYLDIENVDILEIGFGTGLNAFITFLVSKEKKLNIFYKGVEAYPVTEEEVKSLNYLSALSAEKQKEIFLKMHDSAWNKDVDITSFFKLNKQKSKFEDILDKNKFDLIYFDAFGANVQPDLWTESIFKIMFEALKKEGVLVTYSAKGSVKRALRSVGFIVENLPGPPGKREMTRAIKK